MIREDGLKKYPRTPHLEGSRLQEGDSTEGQVKLKDLNGLYSVFEEKLDGANSGMSFSEQLELMLQSRGHFLTGGPRERHFNLMKSWANAHKEALFDVISDRYIVYGEWMYARHSMFYNKLPHYFCEFDVFDKKDGIFLSTARRHELLAPLPIVSVPVLYEGPMIQNMEEIESLVGDSLARDSNWSQDLMDIARKQGLDAVRALEQSDPNQEGEGLYVKIEDDEKVIGRYKWVRNTFTQTLLDNEQHWQDRPLIVNQLAEGVDIFAPTINKSWPEFKPTKKKLKR